ncbi:MAG: CoA-binding protein, partial [Desulfobacterales bacterium]
MTGASFLHSLMTPKSIAILGASNNPMKMGTMHALSILNDGFSGNFYPVHPTEKTILGHKAYKSPKDLPETPDLAIFVLPAKYLLPLFEAFGEIGTKFAIIITAGYKEIGAEGAREEAELLAVARKHGIRFIG